MIGFGVGGMVMGRFADRRGIAWPATCGALALASGYVLSGLSANIWQFAAAHALVCTKNLNSHIVVVKSAKD